MVTLAVTWPHQRERDPAVRGRLRARRSVFYEADAGTRTPDPFITSEVLYQLSYVGAATDASDVLCSAASSDSPCFSQKAGPMPRI